MVIRSSFESGFAEVRCRYFHQSVRQSQSMDCGVWKILPPGGVFSWTSVGKWSIFKAVEIRDMGGRAEKPDCTGGRVCWAGRNLESQREHALFSSAFAVIAKTFR
jgi:hypothetical protein